jgi:hypothetical protein
MTWQVSSADGRVQVVVGDDGVMVFSNEAIETMVDEWTRLPNKFVGATATGPFRLPSIALDAEPWVRLRSVITALTWLNFGVLRVSGDWPPFPEGLADVPDGAIS